MNGPTKSPRTDNSYNLYDLSFEAPEPRQENPTSKGIFDDFKSAWKTNTESLLKRVGFLDQNCDTSLVSDLSVN